MHADILASPSPSAVTLSKLGKFTLKAQGVNVAALILTSILLHTLACLFALCAILTSRSERGPFCAALRCGIASLLLKAE